jgi:hypothetical protein
MCPLPPPATARCSRIGRVRKGAGYRAPFPPRSGPPAACTRAGTKWRQVSPAQMLGWPAFVVSKEKCRWALARPSALAPVTCSSEGYLMEQELRGGYPLVASAGASQGSPLGYPQSRSVTARHLSLPPAGSLVQGPISVIHERREQARPGSPQPWAAEGLSAQDAAPLA